MHEIKWTKEEIARLWNYYSNNLDQKAYFGFHSGKYILNYINRWIKLKEMKAILDFGCGPGYLLADLIKVSCGKVYGLDFSKESINQVNKKFSSRKNFAGAISVDKLPSSFNDKSMEVVIAVEVLEHLREEEVLATLKEIYRILKPEGYVVITTPNSEDLEASKAICPECGCIFHRWQHMRKWDTTSLRKIMEEIGFRTEHISTTVFGSLLKRLYYLYQKLFTRDFSYPHLVYIGKK